jgi:hypothetical protein
MAGSRGKDKRQGKGELSSKGTPDKSVKCYIRFDNGQQHKHDTLKKLGQKAL